jgi:hypothetical protein
MRTTLVEGRDDDAAGSEFVVARNLDGHGCEAWVR